MSTKRMTRVALAAVFLHATVLVPVALVATSAKTSGTAETTNVAEAYAKLPLRFEANRGQTDAAARFVARSGGGTIFLTDTEAVLSPSRGSQPDGSGAPAGGDGVIRMRPLNANTSHAPEGVERLSGVSNYLLGNNSAEWRTGVPGYAGVRYSDVYPGVDLVFHGKHQALEYDFIVAPGGDPAAIAVGFEGISGLELDRDGHLLLETSAGEIRQGKPRLYQEADGKRQTVDGAFIVAGPDRISFRVGAYDPRLPLVIDPVISFATLLGGTGDESGAGLEIDESGNPYIAGTTTSLDFPTTDGAVDRSCGDGTPAGCSGNAYVTKLTADGSAVVYSTYIGGSGTDRGKSVAVDETGSAVVYGDTRSLDFPTTENAFDRTCGNPGDSSCLDVYVARLTADGAGLVYSTFVGGGGDDFAGRPGDTFDVTGSHGVDMTTKGGGFPSGVISLTGTTRSVDFPASHGIPNIQGEGFDLSCGTGVDPSTGLPDGSCNSDAHFTDGSTSAGSTTLTSSAAGFNSSDVGRSIKGQNIPDGTVIASQVDANTVVLSAAATATAASVTFTIVGRNELQPDAFMVTIRWELSGAESLRYGTYFGGGLADFGYGLSFHYENLNGTGVPVVTGATNGLGFPTSPEAFDRTCGAQSDPQAACPGGSDAFAAKFCCGAVPISTYLGGSGEDAGFAVAADAAGNLYITGVTSSPGFPTRGAFQSELQGSSSAFVTKLVPDGSGIIFSSFLGGTGNRRGNIGGNTYGNGIAVDVDRNVYVSGTTSADDFPMVDPIQAFAGFNTDAFVAKIAPSGSTLRYSTPLGGGGDEFGGGVALDAAATVHLTGTTSDAATFPRSSGSTRAGLGGSSEAFVVRLGAGVTPVVAAVSPSGGSMLGGTPVVISGSGLSGATAVRFGDLLAHSFTVASDSRVVAVSPPRPGTTFEDLTVSVTVTTPQGTSFNTVPYVYGEGAFHATQSCLQVCPQDGGMVNLPNGKVLYAGGNPPNSQLFDPASATWTVTGACPDCGPGLGELFTLTLLPAGPASACGTNCGKVLATGERDGVGVAFLYDPASGTWAPTGSMSVPRHGHTATTLPNGKVLVAGGCPARTCVFGTVPYNAAELYDPLTGTWSSTGAMTEPRWLHSATLIDPAKGPCGTNCGKILVAFGAGTGDFGETVSTAELYDPATGTWAATGSTAGTGRLNHAAVQLPGGRIMTIAGEGAFFFGTPLDSVDVFDPVDGEWQLNSILRFPRAYPRATLLPSGKVLVVGAGGRFDGAQVNQAEIWSPTDNRWRSATTTAVAQRHSRVATALLPSGPAAVCGTNCGKVLVAGGRAVTGGDPFLAGAELYTPQAEITAISPAAGPSAGGTAVTITGTGLASAAAFPPFTGVRFGSAGATSVTPDAVSPDTRLVAVSPSQPPDTVDVRVTNLAGLSPLTGAARFSFQPETGTSTTSTSTGTGSTGGTGTTGGSSGGSGSTGANTGPAPVAGYRLVAADGGIFAFGGAPFFGSTGSIRLNQPIVNMASTPSGNGYWLVARDGGVFAFGDARFFGSTGAIRLAQPIVTMARTPSGNGYWLVAADGGVFAFGDARFFGSAGGIQLAQPIVAMAPTKTGSGYWLVAADGGVFAFGDARFFGSTGGIRLAQSIVGITASASGNGYRLVAADGGIFAFGDARFFGSTGAITLNQPMVGMASTASGNGYWLVARDGGIFAFGDAVFLGSTGAIRLNQPMVGMAPS